jgi:hypothetical protein
MPAFWRTCGRITRSALLALIGTAVAGAYAATANEEYQVKAVFLFNFLQFVDWPADAFDDAHSPFRVCILGNDPFGHELDDVMAGEHLENRAILVERHTEVADTTHCHLIFIAEDSPARRQRSLAALQSKPILTVGESDDFAAQGGIIELNIQDKHIKLLVNLQAASDAQLRVSSKLLRKSQIVAARGS